MEEPQDEATQHREAWLVEQAERGRARQRALMNRMDGGEKNIEDVLSRNNHPGPRILPVIIRSSGLGPRGPNIEVALSVRPYAMVLKSPSMPIQQTPAICVPT